MLKEKEQQLKELGVLLEKEGIDFYVSKDSQDQDCLILEWDQDINEKVERVESILNDIEHGILKDIDYISDVLTMFDTDEILHCEYCDRVAYTQDYYNNHYVLIDGYIVACEHCMEHDQDAKIDYFNSLINNEKVANQFLDDDFIRDQGFEKVNQDYYTGLHDFKQTDPTELKKQYEKDYDFIFDLLHQDMFGVEFTLYIKEKGGSNE
jgi:hypothetical protein